jgi:DNA-binding SARP family transcriptional activator
MIRAFSTVLGVSLVPGSFRATVRAGLDRFAHGDLAGASALLSDAVERCPGDSVAEHGDCVEALLALAESAAAQGTPDAALRWYLRVLEHDPDDEAGHLGAVTALLRAGRRTEAHLRYRQYAERMRDRGAEPAPFPS